MQKQPREVIQKESSYSIYFQTEFDIDMIRVSTYSVIYPKSHRNLGRSKSFKRNRAPVCKDIRHFVTFWDVSSFQQEFILPIFPLILLYNHFRVARCNIFVSHVVPFLGEIWARIKKLRINQAWNWNFCWRLNKSNIVHRIRVNRWFLRKIFLK